MEPDNVVTNEEVSVTETLVLGTEVSMDNAIVSDDSGEPGVLTKEELKGEEEIQEPVKEPKVLTDKEKKAIHNKLSNDYPKATIVLKGDVFSWRHHGSKVNYNVALGVLLVDDKLLECDIKDIRVPLAHHRKEKTKKQHHHDMELLISIGFEKRQAGWILSWCHHRANIKEARSIGISYLPKHILVDWLKKWKQDKELFTNPGDSINLLSFKPMKKRLIKDFHKRFNIKVKYLDWVNKPDTIGAMFPDL